MTATLEFYIRLINLQYVKWHIGKLFNFEDTVTDNCLTLDMIFAFIVRELIADDVLKMFLKEREQNGDFVSKASDMFWLGEVMKFVDFDDAKLASSGQQVEQVKNLSVILFEQVLC